MRADLHFSILLMLVLLLAGCSSDTDKMPETKVAHAHEHEAAARPALALNNGQKWQADAGTTYQVEQMQKMLKDFEQGNYQHNPDAYQDLGRELNRMLGQLFVQCTMKGAAHDELHKFLIPVIASVKQLNEEDETTAEEAVTLLHDQLALYQQYFE